MNKQTQSFQQVQSLVQQMVQEQYQGMSLSRLTHKLREMLPSELLTDQLCIDQNGEVSEKVQQRRFMLMSLLSDQVHIIIRQHDNRTGTSQERAKVEEIKEQMLDQKFVQVQLERATHMFALMLSYGVLDDERYQDENNPTLHLLLALADIIMAQQYVQNRAIDKKNMSLWGGDIDVLEQLWAYRDHIIKGLIHNMRIEETVKKVILNIYKRMNYEAVQIGQVCDALLLRVGHIDQEIISLLFYEIDPDKFDACSSSQQKQLLALVNNPQRYTDELWQKNTICISIDGIHPHVMKEILEGLSKIDPERKKIGDRIADGRIFDIRYEYISSKFWVGLVEIMDVFAPGNEQLTAALKALYTAYGQTFQSTNDWSDYLGAEFVRNKHAKDDGDIHADHRNGMITEIVYYLHRLVKEGHEGPIRGEIQKIMSHLGVQQNTVSFPQELTTKSSLKDILEISPENLGEFFMSTGLFLLMMQKNSEKRRSAVTGVEYMQQNTAIHGQEFQSRKEHIHASIGLRLVTLLTNPNFKTPAHIVAKHIQKKGSLPRRKILDGVSSYVSGDEGAYLDEYTTTGTTTDEVEQLASIVNLAHISPLRSHHPLIAANIHKSKVEQLKTLLPVINEMASPKDNRGDIERHDRIFDFYISILEQRRFTMLSEEQFKDVLSGIEEHISAALKYRNRMGDVRMNEGANFGLSEERRKAKKDAYAYIYAFLHGSEGVIEKGDICEVLKSIEEDIGSRFYENTVFRELDEEYILVECREFIDVLMKHIHTFPLVCQTMIRYCDEIVNHKEVLIREMHTLSEAIHISAGVYEACNMLYTGEDILGGVAFESLHIEEQCAIIYRILYQLPMSATEIDQKKREDAKQRYRSGAIIPKNKQEGTLMAALNTYLISTDEGSKRKLMNTFFGWVGSYPTLIMGIQNISTNTPEYIRYLVSFIHTWRQEEEKRVGGVTIQSEILLSYLMSYLTSRDPTNGILYSRHRDTVELLIHLDKIGSYECSPREELLKRSHPHMNNPGDGQELYRDAAIADNYTQLINRWYPKYQEMVRMMLGEIKRLAEENDALRLLDIGCGPGNVLSQIVNTIEGTGTEYAIKGIDTSPSMIHRCQEQFASYPGIRIVCEDAFNLKATEGRYHVVTCNLMSHNIPKNRKQAFLERVYAVLEEGGTLFLTDLFYSDQRKEGMGNCIEGFEAHKEEIEMLAKSYGTTYKDILDDVLNKELRIDIFGGGLISRPELKLFLEDVGFIDIKILGKTPTNNIFISAQKPIRE